MSKTIKPFETSAVQGDRAEQLRALREALSGPDALDRLSADGNLQREVAALDEVSRAALKKTNPHLTFQILRDITKRVEEESRETEVSILRVEVEDPDAGTHQAGRRENYIACLHLDGGQRVWAYDVDGLSATLEADEIRAFHEAGRLGLFRKSDGSFRAEVEPEDTSPSYISEDFEAEARQLLRREGNRATHEYTADHKTALDMLRAARQLPVWFHRIFSDEKGFKPGAFVNPPDPDAARGGRSRASSRGAPGARREAQNHGGAHCCGGQGAR